MHELSEVWDYMTSHQSFYMTTPGSIKLYKVIDSAWAKPWRNIYVFEDISFTIDSRAQLGAECPAGTRIRMEWES